MASTQEIRVLSRKDLLHKWKDTPIEKLEYAFFKECQLFLKEPFVIFIDEDYETFLLKNRYGKRGMIK